MMIENSMTAKSIFSTRLIIIKNSSSVFRFSFRSLLSLIVFFLFISTVFSQDNKWKPIFPAEDINFRLNGWYAGAGATYNFAYPNNKNNYDFSDSSKIDANFLATGKPGFMVEGGRYTMTYSNYVPYIDYGLVFKMFGGGQDYTGYEVSIENLDTIASNSSSAQFSNYYISAQFNANNAIRVSEYGFIQNSLGINIDYYLFRTSQGSAPLFPDTKTSVDVFSLQLHYKIGYGLRLDKKHFLMITLETPLLNIFPWDNGKSTISFLNSRYHPVMLSVRLMFLRNTTRPDCYKPNDVKMNKKHKKSRLF
jgi:hypothetical protein